MKNVSFLRFRCICLLFSPALHSGPSEHKLNWLILYSGCASSESLMKMQGMSNKGKTSFKRQDRKFLVNVTLATVCNWFGWQVLCKRGLKRTAACPCSQDVHNEISFKVFFFVHVAVLFVKRGGGTKKAEEDSKCSIFTTAFAR